MGKIRIIEPIENCEYWIAILHNKDPLIKRRDRLVVERAELLPELAAARAEWERAYSDAASSSATVNILIDSGAEQSEIQAAATNAITAGEESIRKETAWKMLDALHLSKTRAIDTLTSAINVPDPVVRAWCADFTEEFKAGAELGSIEVPDEYQEDRPILIKPGYTADDPTAGAEWAPSSDGCIIRASAQTNEQAFVNWSALPAVQSQAPRFRVAEVLEINGDTARIVIDRERSTAGRHTPYQRNGADAFSIDPPGADASDQALRFEAPIEYMDCNGAVFEAGDRVLVSFAGDWTTPKVIGFESNPKPCVILALLVVPASDSARQSWAQPFDTETGAGTAYNRIDQIETNGISLDRGYMKRGAVSTQGTRDYLRFPDYSFMLAGLNGTLDAQAGNIYWQSDKQIGISYYGPPIPGRPFPAEESDPVVGALEYAFTGSNWLAVIQETIHAEHETDDRRKEKRYLPSGQIFYKGVPYTLPGGSANQLTAASIIERPATDAQGDPIVETWVFWIHTTWSNNPNAINHAHRQPRPTGEVMAAAPVVISGTSLAFDFDRTVFFDHGIVYPFLENDPSELIGWSFSGSGLRAATFRYFESTIEPGEHEKFLIEIEIDPADLSVTVNESTAELDPAWYNFDKVGRWIYNRWADPEPTYTRNIICGGFASVLCSCDVGVHSTFEGTDTREEVISYREIEAIGYDGEELVKAIGEGTINIDYFQEDLDPTTLDIDSRGYQRIRINGGEWDGQVFDYGYHIDRFVDGFRVQQEGASARILFLDCVNKICGALITQSVWPGSGTDLNVSTVERWLIGNTEKTISDGEELKANPNGLGKFATRDFQSYEFGKVAHCPTPEGFVFNSSLACGNNPDPCGPDNFGENDCSHGGFNCLDDEVSDKIDHHYLHNRGFVRFDWGKADNPAPAAVKYKGEYYASFPASLPADVPPAERAINYPADFANAADILGGNPSLWPVRKL